MTEKTKNSNNALLSLIEAATEQALNEILRKFNFQNFKKLTSPGQRIDYAQQNLPEIGYGSSRAVFALSGGKVLKIALNSAGYAQNHAELKVFRDARTKEVVTQIFDVDTEKFAWVVSEIVNPISTPAQFEKYVGIPFNLYKMLVKGWSESPIEDTDAYFAKAIDEWRDRLADIEDEVGRGGTYIQTKKKLDQIILASKSKFIETMMIIVNDHLSVGDVADSGILDNGEEWDTIKHYGYTANGKIVLLDYGLSHEVGDVHYGDRGRIRSRQDISSADKEALINFNEQ